MIIFRYNCLNTLFLYLSGLQRKLKLLEHLNIKKTDLVKDGFDLSVVKDKIYYATLNENKYMELDHVSFQKISNKEVKL